MAIALLIHPQRRRASNLPKRPPQSPSPILEHCRNSCPHPALLRPGLPFCAGECLLGGLKAVHGLRGRCSMPALPLDQFWDSCIVKYVNYSNKEQNIG